MLGRRLVASTTGRHTRLRPRLPSTTTTSSSTSRRWTSTPSAYKLDSIGGGKSLLLQQSAPAGPAAFLSPRLALLPHGSIKPPRVAHATYETSGSRRTLGHLAVAPFLLGTLCWSTYFYDQRANQDLVTAAGVHSEEEGGTKAQILGLFSLFKYLEISTDGPRLDLSPLAQMIDWRGLMELAPTQPALGWVYYAWSSLLHGVDNTVALFPSMDIKPKLVRLGVLEKLEEGLGSSDPTVRLCAAYVLGRLVRNTQVARMVAARPEIVKGVVGMLEEEVVVEGGRFVGFVHSESNASAEVFVTLLETVNNVVEAVVDKEAVILIGASGGHHPLVGSRPNEVLQLLPPSLISKASLMLRHLELCDEHVSNASGLFNDPHMSIYSKFFPHRVDDQVRRRMREVEAEVARFLGGVSKEGGACERLLLQREVLAGLVPLARTEGRNASAFVHAVEGVHNILDCYERVMERSKEGGREGGVDDHDQQQQQLQQQQQQLASNSLLLPSHLTNRALVDAHATVAGRDEGTLGRPFARLHSVYGMRCYISSMACLVAGGFYGILRSAAAFPLVPPLFAYSVNGVGAVLLNAGYGTYGLRNWQKQHTYIEDDEANALWTWGMAMVDVAVVTTIVRRHPYALFPMCAVNYLGFNSSPGTGMKRLDGMDSFFSLG